MGEVSTIGLDIANRRRDTYMVQMQQLRKHPRLQKF
jgi:hypothetical protein